MSRLFPGHLETVRLRVIDRMAALLESQTRSKVFGGTLIQLVRHGHSEIIHELKHADMAQQPEIIHDMLVKVGEVCDRLDQSVDLLFDERQRQWHKNGSYLQARHPVENFCAEHPGGFSCYFPV